MTEERMKEARRGVKTWVEVLKNLGYNFPEESWEVKDDSSNFPEGVNVYYTKETSLSFEETKELAEKLRKEFPDADDLYEEHKDDEHWDFTGTKCCLDYDKFYIPKTGAGLCLWVWSYNKKEFGVCMTNWW